MATPLAIHGALVDVGGNFTAGDVMMFLVRNPLTGSISSSTQPGPHGPIPPASQTLIDLRTMGAMLVDRTNLQVPEPPQTGGMSSAISLRNSQQLYLPLCPPFPPLVRQIFPFPPNPTLPRADPNGRTLGNATSALANSSASTVGRSATQNVTEPQRVVDPRNESVVPTNEEEVEEGEVVDMDVEEAEDGEVSEVATKPGHGQYEDNRVSTEAHTFHEVPIHLNPMTAKALSTFHANCIEARLKKEQEEKEAVERDAAASEAGSVPSTVEECIERFEEVRRRIEADAEAADVEVGRRAEHEREREEREREEVSLEEARAIQEAIYRSDRDMHMGTEEPNRRYGSVFDESKIQLITHLIYPSERVSLPTPASSDYHPSDDESVTNMVSKPNGYRYILRPRPVRAVQRLGAPTTTRSPYTQRGRRTVHTRREASSSSSTSPEAAILNRRDRENLLNVLDVPHAMWTPADRGSVREVIVSLARAVRDSRAIQLMREDAEKTESESEASETDYDQLSDR